jgi:uncharacterized protein
MGIWILMIIIMVMSGLVGYRFQQKFKKYTKMPLSSGLTGSDVAEKMLRDSGIYDVKVISTPGMLTDHYNPMNKTVNLSPEVYNGRSIAAAAVASHECGHAIQHATAYTWLYFRSALVPVVSISNRFVPFVILGGILLIESFPFLMLAGIILFAFSTLFSFVTLPVEFDASSRALKWLNVNRITNDHEQGKAKDALKWAAMTYVSAALASLLTLLYYVMIYMSRRD